MWCNAAIIADEHDARCRAPSASSSGEEQV
jgi:hypothetical protein